MQYLLMIYRNEAELGGMTAADIQKMWSVEIRDRGDNPIFAMRP